MGQLEDMSAFVRIVESGSISRAAEQLGVAKSAMSRRLAELEERLGAQLLQRTTRKSSLTEAGKSYYQCARRILGDVDGLNAAISGTRSSLEGHLKIAAPLSFGLQHLPPAINEFAKAHPELVMQLDFSDRLVDLVEEGFDLTIRIAELEDSTHIARKLAPIKHVICASPAYLEAHGTPRTPQELSAHQALQYVLEPRSVWKLTAPDDKAVNARIQSKMTANNGDFLREAALSGQGLVRLPTFIVWAGTPTGRVGSCDGGLHRSDVVCLRDLPANAASLTPGSGADRISREAVRRRTLLGQRDLTCSVLSGI